jgi:hypothetical protein
MRSAVSPYNTIPILFLQSNGLIPWQLTLRRSDENVPVLVRHSSLLAGEGPDLIQGLGQLNAAPAHLRQLIPTINGKLVRLCGQF